jgi:hypothetical protein
VRLTSTPKKAIPRIVTEKNHVAIDPVRRTRFLNGWDNITLTESYRDKIAAFKAADRGRRPSSNRVNNSAASASVFVAASLFSRYGIEPAPAA